MKIESKLAFRLVTGTKNHILDLAVGGHYPMPSTSIKLLGSFELRAEPDSTAIVTSRKAKVLLALLALRRGRPICRSAIARSLWEYSADRQARISLRQTLLVLKRALPHRQCPWLLSDHDNLAIDLDQVDIDVYRFECLLAEGCDASHRQAMKLYRGELLEGLSFREEAVESWLQSERDRLQLLALDSLTAILLDDTAQGNLRDALESGKRISTIDPLREDVHRSLMQIYVNLGQPQAAIRQFQICKETLSREIGITPQAETTTLYETVCETHATGQSQLPVSVLPAFDHSFDNLARAQDTGTTCDGFLPSAQGSIIATSLPYSRRVAVAVLPFINLTKSAALEPLCLSLSEEIMAALVAWRNFPVVARSSVLALFERTRDARTLGTALNALYLVEGSLKENSGRVRLNLQLVLSTQGCCVWTQSLDFPSDMNWTSYDVLATKIAATIMTQLERAERDRAFVASSSYTSSFKDSVEAQKSVQVIARVLWVKVQTFLNKIYGPLRLAHKISQPPQRAISHVHTRVERQRPFFFSDTTWISLRTTPYGEVIESRQTGRGEFFGRC